MLAAALIVGVALSLRLWNLGFGLPDWYHPDEPIKVEAVLRIVRGELNPGYFYHPTFMLYATAGAARLAHLVGGPLDALGVIRAGRLTVALLGTATVALTYLLGRVIGGRFVAATAALLLAVAPLHVVCSHYLKEDVPMTFWAVAVFVVCLRFVRRGRPADFVLAGGLAGLCAGTKYPGLMFVALPWLAQRERRRGAVPAPRAALLASVAGFLLVTPYALLDVPRFALGIGHEGGNVFAGLAGIAVSPLRSLWTFHLRDSLVPGMGLLPCALALWGFVAALRRSDPAARLLSATVFTLYAVFENSPYKPPPNFDRYVVPMLPFAAVLAAQTLAALRAGLAAQAGRAAPWIGAALLAAAAGAPAYDAVRLDAAMAADTRQAAADWLRQHACGVGRILMEGTLNANGTLVPAYAPVLPAECGATYAYTLADFADRLDDYDVLVASSFMYDRFVRLPDAPAERRRFYAAFFAARRPVAEFRPAVRSYGFHNPTIRIYRLSG